MSLWQKKNQKQIDYYSYKDHRLFISGYEPLVGVTPAKQGKHDFSDGGSTARAIVLALGGTLVSDELLNEVYKVMKPTADENNVTFSIGILTVTGEEYIEAGLDRIALVANKVSKEFSDNE